MEFTKKDLEILENLSKIGCTDQEETELLEAIKQIITYVKKLEEVDTKDIDACNFVYKGLQNVLREDLVEKKADPKDIINDAPDKISNMVKIPPIMEI